MNKRHPAWLMLLSALALGVLEFQTASTGQTPASVMQGPSTEAYHEIGVKAAFPRAPSVDAMPVPDELSGRNTRSLLCDTDDGIFLIGRADADDFPASSRDKVLANIGRGFAQGLAGPDIATILGPNPSRLGGESALEFHFDDADDSLHGVVRVALRGKYLYFAMAAGESPRGSSLYSDFLESIAFLH